MNRKDLVREVYGKLIAQGGPAMEATGFCSYRTSDGRGCAVGILLPNKPLIVELCGTVADESTWACIKAARPDVWEFRDELRQMQIIHDGFFTVALDEGLTEGSDWMTKHKNRWALYLTVKFHEKFPDVSLNLNEVST